jgi:putative transposase
MGRGMKRTLIPLAYSNIESWPAPDIHVFDEAQKNKYMNKKKAVEMYAAGKLYQDIFRQTGKSEDEVRRLIKRCLILLDDGCIAGFYALLPAIRLQDYTRKAAVDHDIGSGSAGCAGALTQLFERFPEIKEGVEERYFKSNSRKIVHEARASIRVIHTYFKTALREKGLTNNDWPFNTENLGYKSLAVYLHKLREGSAGRAVAARSGKGAAERDAVGNGRTPIIPNLRPYSFTQLDFHKVDAASIIIITNEFGDEFLVPISRWHVGFLVEEKFGAIGGAYIALERTPSGDSTLEVVDSALRPEQCEPNDPRFQFVQDGKMLVGHFFPELYGQCFSALKVDNAWSNAAHEVVNNIVDTVGCAVNFGPVHAWWRRNLIESIFGELERRGLQRLPSTYGSGISDTRRDRPEEKAIKFRISLTELIAVIYGCVREHNLRRTEKLQRSSPVSAIKAALERPASGLFYQPLPLDVQQDMRLLMHIEEVTVRGCIETNERPYFTSDRCTYSNDILANAWWLIGERLVIYVDRRKCRNVFATVKASGEQLGKMIPEAKWSRSECSWRDRKLINRSGQAAANSDVGMDPVASLLAQKTEQITKRPNKDRKRPSADALAVARLVMSTNASASNRNDLDLEEEYVEEPESKNSKDPFGLFDVPKMSSMYRER